MQLIQVPGTPAPAGHYSQAVVSHGLAFISGILPVDLRTGEKVTDADLSRQTEIVLANLIDTLHAAGSDLSRVVRTTVYITDVADWPTVNAIYARTFGLHRPARTIVPTGPLHYGALIELDAIAEVTSSGQNPTIQP